MSEVIRAAAKKWFYESFDCDLLEKMEKAGLIAQAEGFSISVMADLELDMEAAFDRVTAERDAALAEISEIKKSLAYRGSLLCRIEGQRDALQQRLTAADELSVTRILLGVVPGDGSGHEVYAKSVAEVEERLSDLAMQAEDLQSSNAQLRDRNNSIVALKQRTDLLEGLLRTSLIAMKRIYQAGYDLIIDAGGTCDTPEYMVESDPTAREIRAALKPAQEKPE